MSESRGEPGSFSGFSGFSWASWSLPIYLQCFYGLAAAAILLANSIPQLATRFIPYGKTAEPNTDPQKPNESSSTIPTQPQPRRSSSAIVKLLDCLATLQVPHAYFSHFYILSTISCLFWGYQIFFNGSILRVLLTQVPPATGNKGMTMEQIVLSLILLLAQSLRRWYECVYILKPSQSKMWILHYLAGIAFYLATGIATWAEGVSTILEYQHHLNDSASKLNSSTSWLSFLERIDRPSLPSPSPKTLLALPIFILASGLQHDTHTYLSTLPKYTLPTAPLFQFVVCPHYMAECLIYVSLAVIGAPKGEVINKTMGAAVGFVVVNLGVAAGSSLEWYRRKWGEESVRFKWKMIPFVY